jgi:hypothetical protein
VFADGSINIVTAKSHYDLFWALRGGGNNFGIVTRFDVKCYAQGALWGGGVYYMFDQIRSVLKALTNINIALPSDPYAALWVATVYQQATDMFLIVPQLIHGKNTAYPPIFKNFTDIPNIGNAFRSANLSEHVAGTAGGYDFRQSYWTATFKNDPIFLERILAIWQEEIAPLKAIQGWVPAAIFQPLSKSLIEKSVGNPFGIATSDGPLIRKLFLQSL